jgi:hypothetical protein
MFRYAYFELRCYADVIAAVTAAEQIRPILLHIVRTAPHAPVGYLATA